MTNSFKTVQIEALDQLQIERASEDERIIRIVERATRERQLEQTISYRCMSGQEAESPMRVIFLTLFSNHAHHRGQVHCLLIQAGVEPDDSDVIDCLEAIKQNPAET
ncbi:MAG TPA: DinB family protein [Dongiaceae bacterium]|nr:DinB family protein [Dongiaceae bacterium]